jgi:hypothetical protein
LKARKRPTQSLFRKAPRVYVGPNAERALRGERGVLLGARRPAWIDVLEFDPRPDAAIRRLVALRFESTSPWEVVGLSLSSKDLPARLESLLRDLVPGDVILTEKGARVHDGADWIEAALI